MAYFDIFRKITKYINGMKEKQTKGSTTNIINLSY